jgi:hypothetical protein
VKISMVQEEEEEEEEGQGIKHSLREVWRIEGS